MSKNIRIIVGFIVIIGFVVFVMSRDTRDQKEEMSEQNRDVVRSEIRDRVGATQTANGEYEIDSEASRVEWEGSAVGKKHKGQITVKNAKIHFVDGSPEGGTFIFDMTSISNDDLDGKMQEKLVAHLKSNDFFAVADYPESGLEIKNAEKTDDGIYRITAELTIKGVTNEITFDAKVEEKNDVVILSSTITIDRTLWNVNYGSDTLGDKVGNQLISDEIAFDVAFVGTKTSK